MAIPVVDMSTVNLSVGINSINNDDARGVATLIKEALLEWGFVYLTKHGIPMNQVQDTFKVSKEFFEQPLDVKEKYSRPSPTARQICGYTGIGRELFRDDELKYADVKECFDYAIEPSINWPSETPKFKTNLERIFQSMGSLAARVLYLLGIALELDTPSYFSQTHSEINSGGTGTSFRTLYYPPLRKEDVFPGLLRCSEHTDYGSMTLLFQDDMGGLLVKRRDGSFVPANPVKGAVLLNISDLMQRWTNDELVSVRHKVVIPEEEIRLRKARQSMVLFVHPNSDTIVTGIKGQQKYPPINAYEYLWGRFTDTYADG